MSSSDDVDKAFDRIVKVEEILDDLRRLSSPDPALRRNRRAGWWRDR